MSGPGLMTPGEVAVALRVDRKTVARWARAGKLGAIKTLGGHRRYSALEVASLRGDVQLGETALSRTDVDVLRGVLEHYRGPEVARLQNILSGLTPGTLIRVTG